MPFKHYQQRDAMDCGPTCLQMVARHHGRYYPQPLLRDWCYIDREGVSLAGISDAAERIGFRTLAVKIGYDKMWQDAPLPCWCIEIKTILWSSIKSPLPTSG